jgi:3-hydroxyisobutyrate dehydrogenase-like beta-hydroxyacid dehydrogenase
MSLELSMDEMMEIENQLAMSANVSVKVLKGVVQNVAKDDELIDDVTTLIKKFYDSLVSKGFSEEQAFSLLSKSLNSLPVSSGK